MSKKSKRQKRRRDRRPNIPMPATGGTPSAVQRRGFTATQRAAGRSEQFSADYTYVKHDLRRIGILAGGFVVILVVLSFFIR